jgi:hypothetical protein
MLWRSFSTKNPQKKGDKSEIDKEWYHVLFEIKNNVLYAPYNFIITYIANNQCLDCPYFYTSPEIKAKIGIAAGKRCEKTHCNAPLKCEMKAKYVFSLAERDYFSCFFV